MQEPKDPRMSGKIAMAALDRILVRAPLRIRRCWRHDTPRARIASDHFPLLAEIALDD